MPLQKPNSVLINRSMDDFTLPNQLYVPFAGNAPAVVNINGHRLVLLCDEQELFEDNLDLLGAERVHKLSEDDFESAEEMLQGLARAASAEVVIAPSGIDLGMFLNGLRSALPWPH